LSKCGRKGSLSRSARRTNLRLSRIEGNIVVGPNGNLLVKGSTITGNVQGTGARRSALG